jgi:hypothetical protein
VRGTNGKGSRNLAIRFLLELAALATFGIWGWQHGDEVWLRYILAIGLPIITAVVWGVFNVPNDPSRSGAAPVVVPGTFRLAIELMFFALAIWSLYDLGHTRISILLGLLVIMHYIASYDRLLWLIKQ